MRWSSSGSRQTASCSTRPVSRASARTALSSSPAAPWTRTSATRSPRSRRPAGTQPPTGKPRARAASRAPPIRASLRAADNSFDHGFRVSRSTLSRPAQNIERARSLGGVFTRAVPRAVSNTRKKTRPWGAPPAAFRSRQTIVWNFRVNVVRRCTKWVQLLSVFDGRMGMLLG